VEGTSLAEWMLHHGRFPPEVVLATARVYIQAFETITAHAFAFPDADEPVLERIRRNLAAYF